MTDTHEELIKHLWRLTCYGIAYADDDSENQGAHVNVWWTKHRSDAQVAPDHFLLGIGLAPGNSVAMTLPMAMLEPSCAGSALPAAPAHVRVDDYPAILERLKEL